MSQDKSFSTRWTEYKPSKALWIWSCVGAIVLTMIVGFTAGGWVTGGTAHAMAQDAGESTRATIVANLCVDKFVSGANAQSRFSELKEADSWERDDMIEDGGWTTISGLTEESTGAADMCADKLAAMDTLPAGDAPTVADTDQNTVDG